MEVVMGALPSLLPKLGELLKDEYNLHKEVKEGIKFLQAELDSIKAALEHMSKIPVDKLPAQDKIWAKNVRELSYNIEDNIDTFMVQVKCGELARKHGFKNFIDKIVASLMWPKIHRKIATSIRGIKSRVVEVHDRRRRYEVSYSVDKPVEVDPRALVRYEDVKKLVGIDEAGDEVIKLLLQGNQLNQVSTQQQKTVSIVGFGGLGKTTLANAVYEKLRAQFDCLAFVSVSQTPDMDKLFRDIFYQLAKHSATSINVIDELRDFLREKRYLIIIDDIWELSYWNIIRCALPNESNGYRIIITTRILTVAEQIGCVYKMKPLSIMNSRILMYGIIFGKGDKEKCLDDDEQLVEELDRILKKCDGIPLAIITMASLLASKGRNNLEWYDVCNSINAGVEESNSIENMRKVLSLSYYDMPPHLRTCLLYVTMFPEDFPIYKNHLIWLWIAEGFIQSGKQERSLFEIGESYLIEIVNRSMIQVISHSHRGPTEFLSVHDMVLELLRSLSSEENFVTIWNGATHSSGSENVRRLSLRKGKASHGKPGATKSIKHVRSVVVFQPAPPIDHVPTLQKLKVLRVLDLRDCNLSHGYSLKYLGNLLHLRYLGLKNTNIDHLPEEIGNLQFLQSLDASGNEISALPSTVVLLKCLLRLSLDSVTRVPKGFGSLTALEDLLSLGIRSGSTYIIEELGNLMELRRLRISILTGQWNNGSEKSLVESLNKLHKVQYLQIEKSRGECSLDGWVLPIAPRHLCRLELSHCWLSALPTWVNPSLLLDLSFLEIEVRGLQQKELEILGRLPALCNLTLKVCHQDLGIHGRFVVGSCSFPCLAHCSLLGFGGPVVFEQGAMPRLPQLELELIVQGMIEFDGGFDLGLGNLLSLRYIKVWFRSGGASKEDVEEAIAAVEHAIEVHSNHPTLRYMEYEG